MQYASLAIANELPIETLEMTVRGHHQLELPRLFQDVIFQVYLEGAIPESELEALAQEASRLCFAENTLGKGIPITTEVHLNGRKALTLTRDPHAE